MVQFAPRSSDRVGPGETASVRLSCSPRGRAGVVPPHPPRSLGAQDGGPSCVPAELTLGGVSHRAEGRPRRRQSAVLRRRVARAAVFFAVRSWASLSR